MIGEKRLFKGSPFHHFLKLKKKKKNPHSTLIFFLILSKNGFSKKFSFFKTFFELCRTWSSMRDSKAWSQPPKVFQRLKIKTFVWMNLMSICCASSMSLIFLCKAYHQFSMQACHQFSMYACLNNGHWPKTFS